VERASSAFARGGASTFAAARRGPGRAGVTPTHVPSGSRAFAAARAGSRRAGSRFVGDGPRALIVACRSPASSRYAVALTAARHAGRRACRRTAGRGSPAGARCCRSPASFAGRRARLVLARATRECRARAPRAARGFRGGGAWRRRRRCLAGRCARCTRCCGTSRRLACRRAAGTNGSAIRGVGSRMLGCQFDAHRFSKKRDRGRRASAAMKLRL
jgi:hypothetical protein